MDFLVFQIQAPLSSWGDTAVGELRGSYDYPGTSSLIGLLGAALGVRRDDEAVHEALHLGYGFAVGLQSSGALLRDYHTAQVPGRASLKGRHHSTRRDELSVLKDELNTILSVRDFRQGAASLVAIQQRDGAPYALSALAAALRRPRFVLYFGRKCCPPAAPLYPLLVQADSALEAFNSYCAQIEARREACKDRRNQAPLEPSGRLIRIAWSDGIPVGTPAHVSTVRKDRPISRRRWQFGDRVEHISQLQLPGV